MQPLIDALQANLDAFVGEAADRLVALKRPSYAPFTRDQVRDRVMQPGFAAFRDDLAGGTDTVFAGYFAKVGAARAQQGAQIDDILIALQIATDVMGDAFRRIFTDQPEILAWWFERMHRIIYAGARGVAQAFIQTSQAIIEEQSTRIREISIPIIPIHEGVLVVPLVGAVDPDRAAALMETVLDGVSAYSADVVIIDITGVPVVDTGVANYLLQAARAAQLLGSKIVLAGISPEIAQTMVQLGVDLKHLVTRANLQSAVEYALRLRNLVIRRA
ncbi:MAG TPA: STAS domain-containing protein [Herpetosiphonaceae bacterium]